MVPVALRKRFHGLSVLDCPIFSGPQESCYIFHGKNKLSPHTALVSHLYHEAQGSSPGADPHRGGMPSQPGQQLVSTSLNLFPLGLCTRPWGSRTANDKVSILVEHWFSRMASWEQWSCEGLWRPGKPFTNVEERKGYSRDQRQQTPNRHVQGETVGNRVILDKFMNCCGEPVTSEVALGQTAVVCLWSVAEGDSWHRCLLLEQWSPSEQCCAGKSRGANRSLLIISPDIPVAAHQ